MIKLYTSASCTSCRKAIEKYPSLLRRPLVFDETKFQVGYNEDEIHQFIPREVRRVTSKKMARVLLYMDLQKESLV